MKFLLSVKDIQGSTDTINHLHEGYTFHFLTKTRNMTKQSFQYIQGKLLGRGRDNMCLYAKDVPDCNNQSLQHFVSNSPWKHQPVLNHIQRDVTKAVGDKKRVHCMWMNVVFQNKERTQWVPLNSIAVTLEELRIAK